MARRLAWDGVRARLIARADATRADASADPDHDVAFAKAHEPEGLAAALTGITRLFLAPPAAADPVGWQQLVVDAARRAGVEALVTLSALGAAPQAGGASLRAYADAEAIAEASGLAWTHLQPSLLLQDTLALAPAVRAEGLLRAPAGQGAAGWVDLRDVARVASRILRDEPGRHAGRRYVLTGPEALTFTDLALTLSVVAGRREKNARARDQSH